MTVYCSDGGRLRRVEPLATTLARIWLGLALSIVVVAARAEAAVLKSADIADTVTCRIVEDAAAFAGVPVAFLTRLVWTESHFRRDAASPAGAEGIAQFMPETAAARGLADPFDPAKAIPGAAELLADLELQFGNLGLAAAAYNAGPSRIESWLAGTGGLPSETRLYVFSVTGHTVEDWARERQGQIRLEERSGEPACVSLVASLRAKLGARPLSLSPDLPFEGNFLTAIALTRFEEARQRYCLHFNAHPRRISAIAGTRQAVALDDWRPPLCAVHPRSVHPGARG